MIDVKEALQKIYKTVNTLKKIEVLTQNATNYIIAANYYSPFSFPPFSQSAMDGYAVNYDGKVEEFTVLHESKAGDNACSISLQPGEACRIFTGAMIPKDANTVIKQEDVQNCHHKIKINVPITLGRNIRYEGEQIKKGELVISKDKLLSPGAIGFLLMLGFEKIEVYAQPRIKIITTGNELIKIGNPLKPGQIYESNSGTLLASLQTFGFTASHSNIEDNYENTKTTIKEAINNYDLVLLTGGISVGDYDFVGKALHELGVEQVFYKVKQKPGKPLFFGKKDEKIIFALPGNPASALTSFYIYVLPALQKLIGRKEPFLQQYELPIAGKIEKKEGTTYFLKGKTKNDEVEMLPAQSSAMLSAFIEANCLIQIDEEKAIVNPGEKVKIFRITI